MFGGARPDRVGGIAWRCAFASGRFFAPSLHDKVTEAEVYLAGACRFRLFLAHPAAERAARARLVRPLEVTARLLF